MGSGAVGALERAGRGTASSRAFFRREDAGLQQTSPGTLQLGTQTAQLALRLRVVRVAQAREQLQLELLLDALELRGFLLGPQPHQGIADDNLLSGQHVHRIVTGQTRVDYEDEEEDPGYDPCD